MGFTYDKSTVNHDEGTGEHSQAGEPTTYLADDVANGATGEAEPQGDTITHVADATTVASTGEHDTSGPVTTAGDWPAPAGEDKVISGAEVKSAPAANPKGSQYT